MKNRVRIILLPLGDILTLIIAFFIMIGLAFPGKASPLVVNSHFLPFSIVIGIWLFVFFLFNLYEAQSIKPTIPNLRRIGSASMVALTASMILFYVTPIFGITPKTNLVIFSIIFVLLFITWRRFFYNTFSIYFRKRVALIDSNKDSIPVMEIANYIETYPQSGFFIFGIYSSINEFLENWNGVPVDTLIVSKNALKGTKDLKLIYSSIENISDLTYAYEDMLGKVPVDSIDETWFLHNIRGTSKNFYNTIVYFTNIITALLLLLIISPLLLLVALLVKLEDGGPIFYTQLRVGQNGKTFKLYKFRSMIVNSETNGAVWAGKNDNRITHIGKIIRKIHIDEIPQMINILKGDLSFVGPRPERPEFVAQLEKTIAHYELRHIIRPGFTGWAQIKYRYANTVEDSKEKFEYDLYYIKNRNFFIDFGIILRTIQIIFTH